jgi:hypothetical protein
MNQKEELTRGFLGLLFLDLGSLSLFFFKGFILAN